MTNHKSITVCFIIGYTSSDKGKTAGVLKRASLTYVTLVVRYSCVSLHKFVFAREFFVMNEQIMMDL